MPDTAVNVLNISGNGWSITPSRISSLLTKPSRPYSTWNE